MRIIERVEDNLRYEGGEPFRINDLFSLKEREDFISYDLTWDASTILKELCDNYEFVEDIKNVKTDYQWSCIESPTMLYMIKTHKATWKSLIAMAGFDGSLEETLDSFKCSNIKELYQTVIKMGFNKTTLAGSSMHVFKTFVESGVLWANGKPHRLHDKSSMDVWRGYEAKDIPALDIQFRTSYRAAITWGRKGLHEHINHIDRRSMYPSTASYHRMPYGLPHPSREDETDLRIVCPLGVLFLRDGCIPMIGFSNPLTFIKHALSGRMGALLNDVNLIGDLWFFEFEWDLIIQMYEFQGCIDQEVYVSTVEPTYLKEYFETFYQLKQTLPKNSIGYVSAKKRINSIYGKFAVRTLRESISYLERRHTYKKQIEDLSYYNILLASSITARARCNLISMAIEIGLDNVLYMDTDSIFFKKEAFKDRETMLKTCKISKVMGGWDLEDEDITINVIGPKTYQTLSNNICSTKCAGLPLTVSSTIGWGELYEGLQVEVVKRKRDKRMILHEEERKHTITSRPLLIRSR